MGYNINDIISILDVQRDHKYLEDNADDIKAKYGEVEFKKYRRRIYLGYCKQI